jgi:hypothetical protein
MIERMLIHVAITVGAALWLARIALSRSERQKLDAAMQALDAASFANVDGLDYQQRIRDEWDRYR